MSGISGADLNVIRHEHYVANEVREYDTYSAEMLKTEDLTDYMRENEEQTILLCSWKQREV